MPPDLALLSTLIGSNYACLELIFMVLKEFEPLKFDCSLNFMLCARTFGHLCFLLSESRYFLIHVTSVKRHISS